MLRCLKLPLCKSTLGSKKQTQAILTVSPLPRRSQLFCRMSLPGVPPSPDPTVMEVGNVMAFPPAWQGPCPGVSAPETLFVGLTGEMKWVFWWRWKGRVAGNGPDKLLLAPGMAPAAGTEERCRLSLTLSTAQWIWPRALPMPGVSSPLQALQVLLGVSVVMFHPDFATTVTL